MLKLIQSVSPVLMIGVAIFGVLVIFLLSFYARVAWEQNAFGIRHKFTKRRRRRPQPPPEYPVLTDEVHDIRVDDHKVETPAKER